MIFHNNIFIFTILVINLSFTNNQAGLFDIPGLFINKTGSKEEASNTYPNLLDLENRTNEVYKLCNDSVKLLNASVTLAHNANGASINAFEIAKKTELLVQQASEIASKISIKMDLISEEQVNIEERINNGLTKLKNEYDLLKNDLKNELEKRSALNMTQEIEKEKAKIQEKQRAGIYEHSEKIKAQASIEKERMRWEKIKEMLTDPVFIGKIALTIVIVALGIYIIKYGIPLIIDKFKRPKVVSETSRIGWFSWFDAPPKLILTIYFFQILCNNA